MRRKKGNSNPGGRQNKNKGGKCIHEQTPNLQTPKSSNKLTSSAYSLATPFSASAILALVKATAASRPTRMDATLAMDTSCCGKKKAPKAAVGILLSDPTSEYVVAEDSCRNQRVAKEMAKDSTPEMSAAMTKRGSCSAGS